MSTTSAAASCCLAAIAAATPAGPPPTMMILRAPLTPRLPVLRCRGAVTALHCRVGEGADPAREMFSVSRAFAQVFRQSRYRVRAWARRCTPGLATYASCLAPLPTLRRQRSRPQCRQHLLDILV